MSQNDKEKQSLMLRVIAGGFLLMSIKFYAYFATNSNAVWSDALEALANVSAGTLVYFALRYAAKPPDKEHPFGHGKIEYFTSGFEGAFVLAAGFASIWKGFFSFFEPSDLTELSKGVVLSGIAGAGNALMGLLLIRKGREMRSLAIEADGKHLLSDALTSVGLIAGLILIKFTNLLWTDGVLAIIFGLMIVKIGLDLLKKSFDGLMDTASPDLTERIGEKIRGETGEAWVSMHGLKILKTGNACFVSYHLVLPWYFNLRESISATKRMNDLLQSIFDEKVEFAEHTEACTENHCPNCPLSCAHRKTELVVKFDWNSESLTGKGES